MAIIDSKFHITIPHSLAKRFTFIEQRSKYEFTVYTMDGFSRFILFEDGVFVFLFKNESNDYLVSSNEEFNAILSSNDDETFIIDFQIDHV